MTHGNGVSRGDRNRNARLARAHAVWSARADWYHRTPPLRDTFRLTVEGDLPNATRDRPDRRAGREPTRDLSRSTRAEPARRPPVQEAGGRFTDPAGGGASDRGGGLYSNTALHEELLEVLNSPRANRP